MMEKLLFHFGVGYVAVFVKTHNCLLQNVDFTNVNVYIKYFITPKLKAYSEILKHRGYDVVYLNDIIKGAQRLADCV